MVYKIDETMRIAQLTGYGTPDKVKVIEVPTPHPKGTQVLVKVRAASLNATDIEIIRGDPIIRIANGLRNPRNKRLGCDLSGIVEEIGEHVTNYKVGDEVYLDVMYQKPAYGALADYIIVPENALRMKPDIMNFEEAATIAQAGVLALQGLTEPTPPSNTSKVLINGAGGGVGSFAIQIAKYYNAEVTGVDHPDKFGFMESIGADHVVNYLDQDFTKLGIQYDIILDVIAKKSFWAYRRALSSSGRYKMVGGPLRKIFGVAFTGMIHSKFSDKSIGLLVGRPNDQNSMGILSKLYGTEKVTPQISHVFELANVQEGLWKLYNGSSRGKIVITMEDLD